MASGAGPTFELNLSCYTTIGHAQAWTALETVLARVLEHFQEADLKMEWSVDGSRSRVKKLASISKISRLRSLDWRGRLLLAFGGDAFTGGFEIYRYDESELARLKDAGLKQHQFSLEIDPPGETGSLERYCDLAAGIAEAFEANYLFCYRLGGFRHQFNTVSEIGIGLLDVYWLNVFGEDWCRLIGRDRLLSAPAHEARSIHGGILLRPSEGFPDPDDPRFRKARDRIKRHIGFEHFAGEAPPRASDSVGSGGPLKLLKFLWLADREYRDESHAAQRRPTFDYSRMME